MALFEKFFGDKKEQEFIPTSETMEDEKFWTIIHSSFDLSVGEFEKQQQTLTQILGAMSAQDVLLFDNKFRQLRGEAYNWKLWAAIYVIHGGCSDDSFKDFRDWVIAQGKDFYYKTLENPETLSEINKERIEVQWEGMGYIGSTIFEELTGQTIPHDFEENHEIKGEEWDEEGDDLKNMFPKLWAKYSS